MEKEETIYCYNNKEDKCIRKRNCLGIISVILLTLFSFVIGLLIGAALAGIIFISLPAIIVLAIILGLLLLLTVILIICNKKKERKCKHWAKRHIKLKA